MGNSHLLSKDRFLRSITFTLCLGSGCLSLLFLVLSTVSSNAAIQLSDDQFLPPATYYGWITPTIGFLPTVNMTVTAKINNSACGETMIQTVDGKLAYSIQVIAENVRPPFNGCGTNDRKIVFIIGNWRMDQDRLWDNTEAWYHSLNRTVVTPTPELTKTPTPMLTATITRTPLSTPTKTITPSATPNPTPVIQKFSTFLPIVKR